MENTQQELFKERRDHRSIIEDLESQLEHVTKLYEDAKDTKSSCASESKSEILVSKAGNSTIACLESKLAETEAELNHLRATSNYQEDRITKLRAELDSFSTRPVSI